MYLDFAGRQEPGHAVHRAIAALGPGDRLEPVGQGVRILLLDTKGVAVAQLSAKAAAAWAPHLPTIDEVRVLGLVLRRRTDNPDPDYDHLLRADAWEVPFCEIVSGAGTPP